MQRLYTRSPPRLPESVASEAGSAPDLATDMGTHNADFPTKWDLYLQKG
jgi:hypothetical protein